METLDHSQGSVGEMRDNFFDILIIALIGLLILSCIIGFFELHGNVVDLLPPGSSSPILGPIPFKP